jgi:hypothetical protein
MARKHTQRFNGNNAHSEWQQKIRDTEFRDLEKRRAEATRSVDTVGNVKPRPLLGQEESFSEVVRGFMDEANGTIRDFHHHHHDSIGVSRARPPKSIHSSPGRSPIGSIPRPKSPPKKPDGNGGKVKLWRGNEHGTLDPYLKRHG